MLPYLDIKKSYYRLMLFVAGGAGLVAFRVGDTKAQLTWSETGGPLSQILERSSKCFSELQIFSFSGRNQFLLK